MVIFVWQGGHLVDLQASCTGEATGFMACICDIFLSQLMLLLAAGDVRSSPADVVSGKEKMHADHMHMSCMAWNVLVSFYGSRTILGA